MSPRRREWSDDERARFLDSLGIILANLKWRRVAGLLGVSTSTITHWRSDGVQPSREHEDAVHALAEKLRTIG